MRATLKTAVSLTAVTMIFGFACGIPAVAAETPKELAVYAGAIVSGNPAYESQVLVEFPFSLNRSELSFVPPDSADGNLYARVFAQLDLIDTSGFVVDSTRTYFSVKVGSRDEAAVDDYRVFNKLALMVSPGTYSARLTAIDVVSKSKGEYFFDRIGVRPPVAGKISLGGLCTAYDIVYVGDMPAGSHPAMYKNGFRLIVNPVSIFADTDTLMYVYGEIYGLAYSPADPGNYHLSMTVFDGRGNFYRTMETKLGRKPGTSAVIRQGLDIRDFATGSYRVQIVAGDPEAGGSDTAYVLFHIVSPEEVVLAATTEQKASSIDQNLTVEDHVNMVRYLLLPEELQTLNSLSDSGKMNYLAQYWREHDVDPTTPVVENRMEMISRYELANRIFSTSLKRRDGWSTDRGRIYMTYGPWDERDDNEAPRVGNSFEVWYYRSIKQGLMFIFEDYSGNDDYRLVHSNVFGEVYNQEWQDRVDEGYIDIPD